MKSLSKKQKLRKDILLKIESLQKDMVELNRSMKNKTMDKINKERKELSYLIKEYLKK